MEYHVLIEMQGKIQKEFDAQIPVVKLEFDVKERNLMQLFKIPCGTKWNNPNYRERKVKQGKWKYLQASYNNIEHGGEGFPAICNVLVNNNASEPNKQGP